MKKIKTRRIGRVDTAPDVEDYTPEAPQKGMFGFKLGDPVKLKDWARAYSIEKVKRAMGYVTAIAESGEITIHFMSWDKDKIIVDGKYTCEYEKLTKLITADDYDAMYKRLQERKEAIELKKTIESKKKAIAEKEAEIKEIKADNEKTKKKWWWLR